MSESKPPTLAHRAVYRLFLFLQKRACSASESSIKRLQWFLDFCFYYIFRVCRSILDTNLQIAFPRKSTQERAHIRRQNYRWFSWLVFDAMKLPSLQGKMKEYMDLSQLSVLDEALSEDNGVLLVGAHFGNWELVCPALAEQGYNVHMYVGTQSNRLVHEHQNQVREQFGVHMINKNPKARFQLAKAIRGQNVLAMLVDQNDRKSDLFVNFFGKQATMSKGVAAFHCLRGTPIVAIFPILKDGKTTLHLQRITTTLTGNKDYDIPHVSQIIAGVLEETIAEYPEQYLWMHQRWRTRPKNDSTPVYS